PCLRLAYRQPASLPWLGPLIGICRPARAAAPASPRPPAPAWPPGQALWWTGWALARVPARPRPPWQTPDRASPAASAPWPALPVMGVAAQVLGRSTAQAQVRRPPVKASPVQTLMLPWV